MTWQINYQWANAAHTAIVWHGQDAVRRILPVKEAWKYGLCLCLGKCECGAVFVDINDNDKRKEEFGKKMPGRIAVQVFDKFGNHEWIAKQSA